MDATTQQESVSTSRAGYEPGENRLNSLEIMLKLDFDRGR
jgi:hypothetical protein